MTDCKAPMEYEIKILGSKENLIKVLRNFMLSQPNSIRDRHYSFNTYYLDTDSFDVFDQGYTIRHRTGAYEIGKECGTEFKAVSGELGELLSARTEIGVRGEDPIANYLSIKASSEFPGLSKDIDPNDLKFKFATAVRRLERQAKVKIDSFESVILESALDDMEILIAEQQKTGKQKGLFDCVLFPVDIQHELEFEIKVPSNPTKKVLDKTVDWVIKHCVKDVKDVHVTTDSKALRAMNRIRSLRP